MRYKIKISMKFFHNTHEKDKKLAYDAAVEQKRETKKVSRTENTVRLTSYI